MLSAFGPPFVQYQYHPNITDADTVAGTRSEYQLSSNRFTYKTAFEFNLNHSNPSWLYLRSDKIVIGPYYSDVKLEYLAFAYCEV